MENIGMLIEYEDVLLKKRRDFSPAYMGARTLQKDAAVILKFAFEDLLGWTPEMVRDYITPKLIHALHLKKPISKIKFPPELSKKDDLFYLAWMMYPETVNCSKRALTLRVYQKVQNGTLQKFPKNFFADAEGNLNMSICLQYAINQNLFVGSVQELYLFFSDKKKAYGFLKKAKLLAPCLENHEYPIDMLHASLPDAERNELYYHYGRFLTDMHHQMEKRILTPKEDLKGEGK